MNDGEGHQRKRVSFAVLPVTVNMSVYIERSTFIHIFILILYIVIIYMCNMCEAHRALCAI